MTTITPFTDAARALAEAAFGNPALRRENEKFLMEQELNDARIGAANASAANSAASAAKTRAALDALNSLSPELFRLDAPITVPAQQLPPDVFGPARPETTRAPTQDEVLGRGSELAALLARSGNLNAGNLGKFQNTLEGAAANIGVTDPNARLRNAAAGAGSPFSETQVKAQAFAGLPELTQQRVVTATPTDQVFGGALLETRTPQQLALLGEQKAQPASIAEFLFSQQNPGFADFAKSTSGGVTVNLGPDGSQASPLTKTQLGKSQEAVITADSAISSLDDAIAALTQENIALESGDASVQTGSLLGSAIAPGSSDNSLIKASNAAFEIARLLPPLRATVEELGATPEEVQRVRANRLKIQNAAVAIERRIANGAATGQFTQQDARDARNATQLITVSGDNNEILSQLNVLRGIISRERNINANAISGGINVTPGQPTVENIDDVDNLTPEQLNALEAELDRQLGAGQ